MNSSYSNLFSIKNEEIIIDLELASDNLIDDWDKNIRGLLQKIDGFTSFESILQCYLNSLTNEVRRYKPAVKMQQKMLLHLKFMLLFNNSLRNCIEPHTVYECLEEILVHYCTLELEVTHRQKKDTKKVFRRIHLILEEFFAEKPLHINHVLLKLKCKRKSEACVKVLKDLYRHNITSAVTDYSDTMFCSGYLLLKKYMELQPHDKENASTENLFLMIHKKDEAARDNNKLLRAIIMRPPTSLSAKVMNVINFTNDCISRYFNCIKRRQKLDDKRFDYHESHNDLAGDMEKTTLGNYYEDDSFDDMINDCEPDEVIVVDSPGSVIEVSDDDEPEEAPSIADSKPDRSKEIDKPTVPSSSSKSDVIFDAIILLDEPKEPTRTISDEVSISEPNKHNNSAIVLNSITLAESYLQSCEESTAATEEVLNGVCDLESSEHSSAQNSVESVAKSSDLSNPNNVAIGKVVVSEQFSQFVNSNSDEVPRPVVNNGEPPRTVNNGSSNKTDGVDSGGGILDKTKRRDENRNINGIVGDPKKINGMKENNKIGGDVDRMEFIGDSIEVDEQRVGKFAKPKTIYKENIATPASERNGEDGYSLNIDTLYKDLEVVKPAIVEYSPNADDADESCGLLDTLPVVDGVPAVTNGIIVESINESLYNERRFAMDNMKKTEQQRSNKEDDDSLSSESLVNNKLSDVSNPTVDVVSSLIAPSTDAIEGPKKRQNRVTFPNLSPLTEIPSSSSMSASMSLPSIEEEFNMLMQMPTSKSSRKRKKIESASPGTSTKSKMPKTKRKKYSVDDFDDELVVRLKNHAQPKKKSKKSVKSKELSSSIILKRLDFPAAERDSRSVSPGRIPSTKEVQEQLVTEMWHNGSYPSTSTSGFLVNGGGRTRRDSTPKIKISVIPKSISSFRTRNNRGQQGQDRKRKKTTITETRFST